MSASWGKVRIGVIAIFCAAALAIPAFASLTTPRAQTAVPPPIGTRSNSTSTQVPGIYVADEGPPVQQHRRSHRRFSPTR